MNFSDLIPFSGHAEFSPNSEYFAAIKGLTVTVYSTQQLNIIATWRVLDELSKLEWSRDSKILMCAQNKRCVVQIFNLQDLSWNSKISLGIAGLSGAWIAPSSREIITITEFQERLNIWSLIDKSVSHLLNPKYGNKGLSFSSDGRFMALAERVEGKDYLGIYYTQNWESASHFELDTFDVADIKWSTDDTVIICWDSSVEYKLLIYSPDGEILHCFSPYQNALGIHSVVLSPGGTYMGVASYDDKVRVIHHVTWTRLGEFHHDSNLKEGKEFYVYNEEEYLDQNGRLSVHYGFLELPTKLGTTDERGISLCKWNHNSTFLASKSLSMPNAMWIWDNISCSLKSVIIHKHSVKDAEWSPRNQILAFTAGTKMIYLWSDDGASVCDMPFDESEFRAQNLKWSPDGQCLIIADDGNNIVVAYPQFEELEGRQA